MLLFKRIKGAMSVQLHNHLQHCCYFILKLKVHNDRILILLLYLSVEKELDSQNNENYSFFIFWFWI